MTGQTLESLKNYPNERQTIYSQDQRSETTRIQNDLNLLNTKKADIDKENTFSAKQTFASGIIYGSKTVLDPIYLVTDQDNFIKFDTTNNAIACSLADASGFLDQNFRFFLNKKGGSNVVTLKTATGDTLNSVGNNTITLNSIDSFIDIISVDTNRWLIVTNNNCSLSTT